MLKTRKASKISEVYELLSGPFLFVLGRKCQLLLPRLFRSYSGFQKCFLRCAYQSEICEGVNCHNLVFLSLSQGEPSHSIPLCTALSVCTLLACESRPWKNTDFQMNQSNWARALELAWKFPLGRWEPCISAKYLGNDNSFFFFFVESTYVLSNSHTKFCK